MKKMVYNSKQQSEVVIRRQIKCIKILFYLMKHPTNLLALEKFNSLFKIEKKEVGRKLQLYND